MSSNLTKIKLSNGNEIPILGLGTYKAKGGELITTIRDAIDIGYRHFDTADFYENMESLGEAIREVIANGKVKRDELFITTKVWPTYYGEGRVEASVRKQLKQSGLDYFDLVLLHWPIVFLDDDSSEGFPLREDGKIAIGTRPLTEVYKELEKVQIAGLTRSIGVSNFNSSQIDRIVQSASIQPVMNQVEAHVYLSQKKLQQFCSERKIVLTAYCPLAAGGNKSFNLLEDKTLNLIANNYKKSAAQIAIRYLIQRGLVAIPKSIRKERLESNFNVFDFEITNEDMETLKSLDYKKRAVWFDFFGTKDAEEYPFKAEF